MDNRVIATLPVMQKIVPIFAESARTVSEADDRRFADLTELERARLVAGLNNALGALTECEKVPGIMSTPGNKIATLLQSMVVANATDAVVIPNRQTLEAKFDTHDWTGWLGTFWEMLKKAKKFDWVPAAAGVEQVAQFSKPAPRMALFGDWGTGLYGAPLIKHSIETDASPIDIILHLGDVYYSGKKDEFASRFTAMWPKRADALSRALNGNHEMYCGGQPYMNAIATAPFQQSRSHFAYANDHWVIVGLDTAYEDHSLTDSQVAWLSDIVDHEAQGRRVVLFSHHQPFSFLSGQGPNLVAKMKPLLEGKKIFAWFWGHEHACVLYDKHPQWNMYGRCIGHAGMPEFRPKAMGAAVDTRQFRRFPAKDGVPASSILDGPNPYVEGEEKKFTPHGYAMLVFEDDRLVETIHDADNTPLVTTELV